jgi:hypothetical protein
MKLAVEVQVPDNLLVPAALLAELIGPGKVVMLLHEGQIERGAKDYHHRKGRRTRRPVSADEVSSAQNELQRQAQLLDDEIREATTVT